MATNLYFNNYEFNGEQNLVENLIIESIKIYGVNCYYMPRKLIAEDKLFGEDILSKFNTVNGSDVVNAHIVEMYIKSVDGFEGEGDFLSKFNIEIRDEMVLTVARKRFEQEIPLQNSTNTIGRPSEGDLIYFPLNNKIFEVKFVEHESVFYQMGSLQTYDLRCELFEYSHERLNTGIAAIDGIEDAYSADLSDRQILDEAGNNLIFESGEYIADDVQTDQAATNILFDTKSNDFLDFSEVNPFGEGGEW
tara:strand:+ start:460 stop:1206 length:747 start_codon:yes stop_codon:yes gene_type:complete